MSAASFSFRTPEANASAVVGEAPIRPGGSREIVLRSAGTLGRSGAQDGVR